MFKTQNQFQYFVNPCLPIKWHFQRSYQLSKHGTVFLKSQRLDHLETVPKVDLVGQGGDDLPVDSPKGWKVITTK